jgi:hypothetical protein
MVIRKPGDEKAGSRDAMEDHAGSMENAPRRVQLPRQILPILQQWHFTRGPSKPVRTTKGVPR